MDAYDFDVRLTPEALRMLRPGEALVLDRHKLAICCAGAGESSLDAVPDHPDVAVLARRSKSVGTVNYPQTRSLSPSWP